MSNWSSLPAVALPACALSAALLLPPGEVSAQRPPKPEGRSLNAAIAEAKRSPFWPAGHAGALQAADSPFRVGPPPVSRREDQRAGEPNDEPRHLGLATALGIAAGDLVGGLVGGSLCDDDDVVPTVPPTVPWLGVLCFGLVSSSVTAAANLIAGAPPGAALLGSFLGTGLGLGTGYLVFEALEEPLYILAPFPALIAYYAVRFAVTLATVRHLGRDG